MTVAFKKIAEELVIPVDELKKESVKSYLEREIRLKNAEIISLANKYGVTTWEEMNDLITNDEIEEGKILEDFQRVDHLTAEVRKLKRILQSI